MNAAEREPLRAPRGKRIGFRLTAIGLGLVVALGLAELTLRVLGVRPPVVQTKTYLTTGSLHYH